MDDNFITHPFRDLWTIGTPSAFSWRRHINMVYRRDAGRFSDPARRRTGTQAVILLHRQKKSIAMKFPAAILSPDG